MLIVVALESLSSRNCVVILPLTFYITHIFVNIISQCTHTLYYTCLCDIPCTYVSCVFESYILCKALWLFYQKHYTLHYVVGHVFKKLKGTHSGLVV